MPALADAFPLWHRSRLPPIRMLSTPAEVASVKLTELCRRRTDNEPTPKVEVNHERSHADGA